MAKAKKPAKAIVQPGYSVVTLKGMAHSGAIVKAKDLKCEDPEDRFDKLCKAGLLKKIDQAKADKEAEEAEKAQAKANKERKEAEAAKKKAEEEEAEAKQAEADAKAAKDKANKKK